MHNSLNERFFSFISIFRNDFGIIPEKDRNLLGFGVRRESEKGKREDGSVKTDIRI